MDGKEIFRKAVRVVVESAERAMADAGLTIDDIALLVPHQANLRIIQAAVPAPRHPRGAHRGRDRPLRQHLVGLDPPRPRRRRSTRGGWRDGDHLLLTGFGGGMTWAQRRSTLGGVTGPDDGADVLVILAAGRGRKRYGGVLKPLAPVGPDGEAVIDLVASDALAAGFTTIVLVVGPATGPAIRYHVERNWPGRRSTSASPMQEPPCGTVDAVLRRPRSSTGVGAGAHPSASPTPTTSTASPACACWPRTWLARGHQRPGRLPPARPWWWDAPVTRGLCEVDDDGILVSVIERRQVTAIGDDGFAAPTASTRRSSTATRWCR